MTFSLVGFEQSCGYGQCKLQYYENYGDRKYGDFAGQYALTVSNLLISLRNSGGNQRAKKQAPSL